MITYCTYAKDSSVEVFVDGQLVFEGRYPDATAVMRALLNHGMKDLTIESIARRKRVLPPCPADKSFMQHYVDTVRSAFRSYQSIPRPPAELTLWAPGIFHFAEWDLIDHDRIRALSTRGWYATALYGISPWEVSRDTFPEMMQMSPWYYLEMTGSQYELIREQDEFLGHTHIEDCLNAIQQLKG